MKTRLISSSPVFSSLLCLLVAAGACSEEGDEGTDGGGDDDGAGSSADYEPLLTTSWTLPPPTSATPDQYFCARLTVTEDLLVTGFRTISPNGTHHSVLSIGDPIQPDTAFEPCFVQDNRMTLVYAAGIGTDDFVFPEGVGLRIEAGQQLTLNVHAFNATDFDLGGTSGVAVKLVESVETEAGFNFIGPVGFSIEPDGQPHEVSGSCAIGEDATVLNWWPHMHRLGVHQKIQVNDEVVHDGPFTFTEQLNYPTNHPIAAGDRIRVTCTFVNDTGDPVAFGDSSNEEMCFAGLYRYPKAPDDQGSCLSPPE